MTDDFFVSVSSKGEVTLNCPFGRTNQGTACDWWYWWEMYPSIRTLRKEAKEHLEACHSDT